MKGRRFTGMHADNQRIGVAVSGGADSVYLLHELVGSGELVVLHVNHELRGAESDGDERFVRELAASLGVECLVKRPVVGAGNLEQEARRARYEWFAELVEAGRIDKVALGHTRSDQAETVLFRFLRGAGTAGLAGIRPETELVWRPLLEKTREDVRDSLRARGIVWREDSSNLDNRFARNRIRGELLPVLRDWNSRIEENLAQTAEWALAEESYWTDEIRKVAGQRFVAEAGGLVVRTAKLPVAVERRLLRHALERVKGDLLGIEFGHVEAVRELKSGRVSLPGLEVEKSFEWVRITAAGALECNFNYKLRLELCAASDVYNIDKHQIDWGRISGPLELRHWQSGDRYQRVGRLREERLKLLFQTARIPVWERRRWPVLMCGTRIGWTREFGVAAGLERTKSTREVLVIREISGIPNRKPQELRHKDMSATGRGGTSEFEY